MDPRAFIKDVKRIVIKVGTAVVTRGDDGRIALGRLVALCEQIKKLHIIGYEVILVTSGAVSVGRQTLQFSFAELDDKVCAAVGQNGLMDLYDALFSQLDLTCAQLLITDNDFRNPNFRSQISETVNKLLDLEIIPVVNENHAVTTRKAPYKDSSGIFWDNDSLAALVAVVLKADLLILLSDMNGLYTGAPDDQQSKLIHTFIENKDQEGVSLRFMSRMCEGGFTIKVKSALAASRDGVPVIIASGMESDTIIKIIKGQRVGTLFHKDAHLFAPTREPMSPILKNIEVFVNLAWYIKCFLFD